MGDGAPVYTTRLRPREAVAWVIAATSLLVAASSSLDCHLLALACRLGARSHRSHGWCNPHEWLGPPHQRWSTAARVQLCMAKFERERPDLLASEQLLLGQ